MKSDYNSTKNQGIKSKFIGREVFCCVSSMMGDLLECKCDLYEEIENFYCYNINGDEYSEEERQEKIEYLQDQLQESCDENRQDIEEELQLFEDAESEPQGIFEWWVVSNWLFEKLKAKGQPVIEYGATYIWGRCTTGQAILLDYVIGEICEDLGILEGQENEWSKNA